MTVAATAHHSTDAIYDPKNIATVEGEVVLFLFRNPHSFVQIEARDPETGQAVPVALEWEGAKRLGRDGVSAATLKAGDHVIVTGQLARKPGQRALLLQTISRLSDGWRWSR